MIRIFFSFGSAIVAIFSANLRKSYELRVKGKEKSLSHAGLGVFVVELMWQHSFAITFYR